MLTVIDIFLDSRNTVIATYSSMNIVSNQMARTMGNKIETIENRQFFQGISNTKINK